MIGNQIDIETSEELSTPITLYKVNMGQVDYYLTSYNDDVSFNNHRYTAMQIEHSEIIRDMTAFDDKLSISVPLLSPQGKAWANDKLLSQNTIEILRYQPAINNAFTMYRGVVVGRKYTDTHIVLDCLPISTVLNKMCNRAIYSRQCRYQLYSSECGVNKAKYEYKGIVTTNSLFSILLKLDPSKPFSKDDYQGGIVSLRKNNYNILINAIEFIITGDNLEVKLENPVTIDVTGFEVKIYQTCNKSKEMCNDKFNNINRFGGFPYIPIRNIFVHNISY